MLFSLMLAFAMPQDAAVANNADLQCMALFSASTAEAPEDKQAGLVAGTMFFYGKISGRSPRLDVEAEMFKLLTADPRGEGLEKNRQRCAGEMKQHGDLLIAMGQRMVESSKGQ